MRTRLGMLLCLLLVNTAGFSQEQEEDTSPQTSEAATPAATASSISRVPGRVPGQMVLPAGDGNIAATLLEERLGRFHGAVLILHDVDGHMDSEGPVATLRRQLPEHGWTTMTVEMRYGQPAPQAPVNPELQTQALTDEDQDEPETPADADTDTASPDDAQTPTEDIAETAIAPSIITNQQRINAALTYLESLGAETLILIAVGHGAELAVQTANTNASVDGLVMFSVADLPEEMFTELTIPTLEIFARRDNDNVITAAKRRLTLAKRQQSETYSQQQIVSTDREYRAADSIISGRVRAWLYRTYIDIDDSDS